MKPAGEVSIRPARGEAQLAPVWLRAAFEILSGFKPQALFLAIGLGFGLIFLAITPPFQAADEYVHFFRAYDIAQGHFRGSVGLLPTSLNSFAREVSQGIPFHPENKQGKRQLLAEFNRRLNPSEREPVHLGATVVYSPLPYLPQVFGIEIGRILSLPPVALLYLGRLFNLLAWSGLMALAIRTMPVQKWVLLLLALMPMTLFQATSLSADTLTTGLCFLFTAVVLRMATSSEKPAGRKELAVLAGLGVLIGLAKQTYILVLGVYFLIPVSRVGSWRRYWLWAGMVFLPATLISLAWSLSVSGLFVYPIPEAHVAPGEQIRFVLENPLRYLAVLGHSIAFYKGFIIKSFVGVLGWLDTYLPTPLYIGMAGVLLLAALLDHKPDIRLNGWQRLVCAGTAGSVIAAVFSLMYLFSTGVGAGQIEGVQGRYFLPIAPLLALLGYNRRLPPWLTRAGWAAALFSIVILAITLRVLITRYYV